MRAVGIRWVLPFVVLGLAVVIARVMIASREAPPRSHHEVEAPAVNVITVADTPLRARILSQGEVRPLRDILLQSEVSGRVIDVADAFRTGARVERGTFLLQIDPIDYEVALADARASRAAAEFSLAEVVVLKKKAAIAEAEARVKAAAERIRQAESDLANTRIVAPFDAIIDSRQVELAQYVRPGDVMMRLLDTGLAEVRLPLTAADMPYAEFGQRGDGSWPAAILTASFGEITHSWTARVVRVEQRVDSATRTYYAVAEIDHPYDAQQHGMALSAGVFVAATLEGVAIDHGARLPRSALHTGNRVFLVDAQSRLAPRSVEPLRFELDDVIVRGLEAGDRVLASRIDLMVAGREVRVLEGAAQ